MQNGEGDVVATEPKTPRIPPVLIVVTGASGAGKTTLVERLAALRLEGVGCYHFDSIGVPNAEEMATRFAGGDSWQAWALDQWVCRIARNEDCVTRAVLDAQVRPTAAIEAGARYDLTTLVVLIDCATDERNARLRGQRGQPDLATGRMDMWAAYLRGQADALRLAIIDTSGRSIDESVAQLRDCTLAAVFPFETARQRR